MSPTLPYEAEAQAFAAAHNFDIETLMYERDRYAFGSLSCSFDGQRQRDLRGRALRLAFERQELRTSEAA